MNPIQQLLNQIISALPAFQQSLGGFLLGLRPFAGAVLRLDAAIHAFVASLGGWQGIARSIAQSRIGQAVGPLVQSFAGSRVGQVALAAAGAVGRFAGSALGVAAGVGQAAIGMIGAALATPLGQVALAAAGVALALPVLGVAVERAGRTLLETQRHLAQSSAAMAQVFAQSDLRKTMREMRAGNEQAGTAGFLARGLDNLADTLQPILSLLANIANVAGGVVVRIVDLIVTPIGLIVDGINALVALAKKIFPWAFDESNPLLLSQWLDKVTDDARSERDRNAPFRGMKFA